MKRTLAAILSLLVLAFLTTGCSTMRRVDNDVTAFSNWKAAPPGPGTTYRFERLPSQQALGAQQDQIEALARTALAKVGMELNPAAASYGVQVTLSNQVIQVSSYDGGYGMFGGPSVFMGGGNHGAGFGLSFPIGTMSRPYYRRNLGILIRELKSQQVVFESHALQDDAGSDTLAVLPAMLDAALQGFPQPPPGTRRISVEIPR